MALPPHLRAVLFLLLTATLLPQSQAQTTRPDRKAAAAAYGAGARLIDQRDFPGAESEFTRAVALDPSRTEYALALTVARQSHVSSLVQQSAKARLLGQTDRADALLAEARILDPTNDLVREHLDSNALPQTITVNQQTARDLVFAEPIRLQPTAATPEFHSHGDARQVVTEVAAAYGIKVAFDDSVTSTPIRFDLEPAPYGTAMPILLSMTHLFAVPVDTRTLLLSKDTQENRLKYERQLQETIFIPGSTQEQLNEILNVLKNIFDIRQIAIQPTASALVIRAPEPTLKAVNYTVADLVDGGAQVMLELKLYTIDKTHTVNLGLNAPTSAGAFSVAQEAQSIVAANQTAIQTLISSGYFTPTGNVATDTITEALYLIATGVATDAKVSGLIALVGGGLTTAGIYVGNNPTLNFALNSSEARALDDITIRLGDRQETTLRVGSKYPITTSTFSSGLSAAATSALAGVSVNGTSAAALLAQFAGSASVIPQIQYEDLGITLKATPAVQKSGLISIKIELKIEALTGASNNNIPILTSRFFQSNLSVPEGATALMLSDLSSNETAAVSGIPGLASLPGFQESLADKASERDSSELVLLVTPRLVRRRSNTLAGPRIAFQTSVPSDF